MENNSTRYLVRLTPIDAYFFGGEVTFGDNKNQNYLVKSNYLPQQSALLGLMRYEILRQNDMLFGEGKNIDKNKVEKLIGAKGFDPTQPAASHGIIKKISPVFIEKQEAFYTRMPLDADITVSLKKELKVYYNGIAKPLPTLEGYDYKEYNNYCYWCSNNISNKINESDIFIETERIGIQKNKTDDAFFKQTLIRLKEGYNFAFTIDIDNKSVDINSFKFNEKTTIATLGGNQSRFKIEITECNQENNLNDFDFCEYFKPLSNDNRILLLGDAIIPDAIRDKIDFIWGNCIENRYIVRAVSEDHSWGKPKKTEALYHLQSRGSVIFHNKKNTESKKEGNNSFKNIDAIKQALSNESHQAIGLNIFI